MSAYTVPPFAESRYPAVYHKACYHLVAFGAHGGDTQQGRRLIAAALRAMRATHGRARAQRERRPGSRHHYNYMM